LRTTFATFPDVAVIASFLTTAGLRLTVDGTSSLF
jgi:hypothetical protein